MATLGLGAWIAALALTIWNTELARTLTAALALGALAFAAYLVILQLFVIDAVCVWCMVNDLVLVPALTVLALLRLRTRRRASLDGGRGSPRTLRCARSQSRASGRGGRGHEGTVGSRLQDPREARQKNRDVRA